MRCYYYWTSAKAGTGSRVLCCQRAMPARLHGLTQWRRSGYQGPHTQDAASEHTRHRRLDRQSKRHASRYGSSAGLPSARRHGRHAVGDVTCPPAHDLIILSGSAPMSTLLGVARPCDRPPSTSIIARRCAYNLAKPMRAGCPSSDCLPYYALQQSFTSSTNSLPTARRSSSAHIVAVWLPHNHNATD